MIKDQQFQRFTAWNLVFSFISKKFLNPSLSLTHTNNVYLRAILAWETNVYFAKGSEMDNKL
jgi:hypothetical protein